MKPTLRKPLGILAILIFVVAWCVGSVTLFAQLTGWSNLALLPLYIIAGVAWIAPLKPVLRWMELGKWRE